MNYEQKYNEALNLARSYYSEDANAFLIDLFPELAESEDERIRKGLIEALKTSKTVGELKFILPEPTREEAIVYLEKQKEHQNNSDAPNESSWSGMISSSDKDKNLDEIAQDYIDGVKEYNPEPTWDLMQTAVCYGYHLAEQKEQKHPNGCFTCDEYKKGYEAGRSNGFTAGYNKAMKEQKPVKKEITLTNFEEVLNTFLFDFANSPIEDCEPKEYTKKHSAEILKAAYTELNAQLKQDIFEAQQEGRREAYEAAKAEQKPAEWSEEDELMRKRCIVDLGYLTEYEPQYKERYDAQINWLESLRPKPKQEWGEEDKTNGWTGVDSERYISCLQRLGTGNPQQPETINSKWFKEHCQPQPKQEWSEEDERMLSRCIKSKDLLSKHRKECIKGIRYDKRRSDD